MIFSLIPCISPAITLHSRIRTKGGVCVYSNVSACGAMPARWFRFIKKKKKYCSSWKHALVQPVPEKGDLLNLLMSIFLSGRFVSDIVDGSTSPILFFMNIGVPQDYILSPTFFLLLINDILSLIDNQLVS